MPRWPTVTVLRQIAKSSRPFFIPFGKSGTVLPALPGIQERKKKRNGGARLCGMCFPKLGRSRISTPFFDELYDRFVQPQVWRLFPDVFPVLQEAKKRKPTVGIVSNWDSRLFGICEGLGLSPYLDFILASAVVGAAKPNSKIFLAALRRAQVLPEEAVHVGDSLIDDIWGAERVGIRGILIDRSGSRSSKVVTISTLQFFSE